MRTRTMIMTGIALAFLAAPAFAGESSPAEKEATRQLNLQAARDAAPSPMVAASATPAPALPVRMAAASAAPLSAMTDPPSKIATANVLDNTGRTVGAVQKIEVSPDGKPTKVSVALIGAKEQTVVLDASTVSYDAHKNEITSQNALPSNG